MTRGEYMRRARERAGLNIKQLSVLSGISVSSISGIELGKYNGSIATIELLADALGLSIDEYVGHEV